MPSQSAPTEHTSLGEYLRDTRINLGLDLATVAGETRISSKSLQAIEDNDFAALPAEAFARGFYAMYAKALSLDPEKVLQMYTKERPKRHKSIHTAMLSSGKMAQEVGSMAERPSFIPFSFLGLVLLLLLIFGGVLCWYFSWNPATFLSQKLRSLGEPQRVGQVSENYDFRFQAVNKLQSEYSNFFNLSYPTMATAAVAEKMVGPDQPKKVKQTANYTVNAQFSGQTEIKLAVDNSPEQTFLFKSGDFATWQANEKVVLTLPPQAAAKLTLNDVPINLPDSGNRLLTLCLPKQLQQ